MAHNFIVYPSTESGKILKGFCPTVCRSDRDFAETLLGWIRYSCKYGIEYYVLERDGKMEVKPLL